jgi:hypothetical protein
MSAAPAIIVNGGISITDRIKIQQERIRNREYIPIGRLTTVVWEGQRSAEGFSQEHAPLDSFTKWQRTAWCGITLDWLTHRNAPILAISRDRNDLLLPYGLTALPDIPDPRFNGFAVAPAANCKDAPIPRIKQVFAGCPVVGDRACGRIQNRVDNKWYLIFSPLSEAQIMCGHGKDSGMGRIRFGKDPADKRTHAALLVNEAQANDGTYEAYFLGGSFFAG